MTVDPRAALDRLVAALEAHFHAVSTRRTDDDPAVDDAYDVLADAFEVYEDALVRVYSETMPIGLLDEDDDADEDDDSEDTDLDDDLEDDDLEDEDEDEDEDDADEDALDVDDLADEPHEA